ncbi:MAG TPA: TonB-dependent receptor, partial [Bacteroidota bacterium]|nr:TonB-dependent receptor [Bacteroidota bacterium]
MRSVFFFIVFSFLLRSLAIAAETDTVKTYHANEVVVTATRTAINPDDAPAFVQVVTAESIQGMNAKTAADVVSLVSGIYVRDYGSETGMKNISIHGLSPTNATILLDGSPINQALNGEVDLSLLPASSIDHIEYMSGGASALYGGNALGGVINIVSRRADDGFHASAMQELGSFDERRTAVEGSGMIGGIGNVLGYTTETGLGNFPYVVHQAGGVDTTVHQTDNDYHRTSAYWNGNYQMGELADFNSSIQYVNFERGTPSIYSSTARLQDENIRFIVGTTWHLASSLTVAFHGIYTHDDEISSDTSSWTDTRYLENGGTANTQIDWSISEREKIVGGIEYGEHQLDETGLSYGSMQDLHPDRVQKSAYLSSESKFSTNEEWFSGAGIFVTGRYDAYSDVQQSAFSPKIGINILINKFYDLHLRSSWSKNFRVPTFNDLYFPGYSNPSLLPERSNTVDVGLLGSIDFYGRHNLQVTYYTMDITDKIAYGTNFVPYNIGQAAHQGMDVRYEYRTINNIFNFVASGSYVDAEDRSAVGSASYGKQLPLVPEYSGVLNGTWNLAPWSLNIQEFFVGSRYTDAANIQRLPFYALTDVSLRKSLSLLSGNVTLQVSAKNIFNRDYQVYQFYPMPGRSLHVSAAVDF